MAKPYIGPRSAILTLNNAMRNWAKEAPRHLLVQVLPQHVLQRFTCQKSRSSMSFCPVLVGSQ